MNSSRHERVSPRGWYSVHCRLDRLPGSSRASQRVALRLRAARPSRHAANRRAVALLEVILALGLLLIAMVAIGVIFRNGQYFIEQSEMRTRAMLLTEKLITDLDTGLIVMEEREQSGYFVINGVNEGMPGMSWKIEEDPSKRVDGLLKIDISIFMGDPDDEEQHKNILRTRIVRAEPRGFDFERDFGLDEDQIQQLTDAIPGGTQILDPTNFDPRALAQLPADQLVELLPTLIQAFGAQIGSGQLNQLLQLVNSGNLGNMQNVANQALNQAQNQGGNQAGNQGQSQTPDQIGGSGANQNKSGTQLGIGGRQR